MRPGPLLLLGTLLAAVPGPAPLAAQTVDTVVVINRNVFDSTSGLLRPVATLVNALHVTTRAAVIRRTLLLDPGRPYDSTQALESERALRALGVFRNVRLDTVRVDGRLALRVATADGWSTRPEFGYSTAGGSTNWSLGLVEKNLLGLAHQVEAFYGRTPDRSTLDFIYRAPALLARRAVLYAGYEDLSDGRIAFLSYGVPFYETAAPASLGMDAGFASQRALRFRDGALADSAYRREAHGGLTGGVALAADDSAFTRLWYFGRWRRESYAPYGVPAVTDSTGVAAGAALELGRSRFAVAEALDQYARREDVDVSRDLFVGAWLAPGFAGNGGRAGIGPLLSLRLGAAWGRTFAFATAGADALLRADGVDSGRVEASATLLTQRFPRQTLVLHAEGGAQRRPAPGSEFDLWLTFNGPRGYGAHVFTGTRRYWLLVEDRFLVTPEFARLFGVGLAPFVEWGGAWYGDERPRAAGDAGLALRLGATRSTRGEVTEIAISERFGGGAGIPSGWAVTVRQAVDFR